MILRWKNTYGEEKKTICQKATRPRFGNSKGATWDVMATMKLVLPDESIQNVQVWLDTSWGRFQYFQIVKGAVGYESIQWYKVPHFSYHNESEELSHEFMSAEYRADFSNERDNKTN